MADLIDAAIEAALLDAVDAFAVAQAITYVGKPNVQFRLPEKPTPQTKALRATILPAPTVRRQIADDGEFYYSGLLQIDCFFGQGAGLNMTRLAAAVIAWFPPGKMLQLPELAPQLQIVEKAYRSGVFDDLPWSFVPVRVPYQLYA